MTTTPVWVTLATASSLGGLLTLVGVIITQRHTRLREDARWNRECEREQTRWAREDAARSYEHRRAAYVDFTKEFHHQRDEFDGNPDLPNLMPLYDRLSQIQIFGTTEAAQLADEAYNTLVNWMFGDEETIPEAEDVLAPLRSEIRRDLSIPSLRNHQTKMK